MEEYLFYIGKSALAAGAFYLVYLLLFQNQKQFKFNRIYLTVSLALSFIIPLITFTKIQFVEPISTSTFDNSSFLTYLAEAVGETSFVFQWFHYLIGIYILGIAGFLFHLLLGHIKALSIIKYSRTKELYKTVVNITPKDVHPFSFFNRIVLSENTLKNPSLEIIVSHENIHVKEKHTLDILFAEILFLFQWFNPFAWLIKDAIKNNLEYKTDHQIAKTYNPQSYQLAMVEMADKEGIAPFLTALNGYQLKNRIIMMKKKTVNKYAFLKQLVVLPLLAILIMGLANREVKTVQTEKKTEHSITGKVTNEKGDPIPGASVIIKGKATGTITDLDGNYKLQSENKIESLVFVMKDYKKQEITLDENSLQVNVLLKMDDLPKLKKGKKKPLIIIDGIIFKGEMSEIKSDKIESVTVLKDASATKLYDEKGKNGVILITTKESAEKKLAKALVIVNGKVYDGDISDISYGDIEKVDVLKNESATKLYGKKAKDGAIIITTKKQLKFGDKTPLIYINGVKSEKDINDINPDEIKSIDILKDASAIAEYGSDAKNGVILITTKYYEITSPLELRKFIANRIHYPEKAKLGKEGVAQLFVSIDKFGIVTKVSEMSTGDEVLLDEVVVIGYKPDPKEVIVSKKYEDLSNVFADETKRIINQFPTLNIPEFKDKTLAITVKFQLQ